MIDSSKKYKKQGDHAYPHIGDLLQTYFYKRRVNKAAVARELGVNRIVVSKYLLQQSLQLGILWKMGLVLKYNFLGELAEQFPVKFVTEQDRQNDAVIKEQQDRIEKLEAELEIYKRIVGK